MRACAQAVWVCGSVGGRGMLVDGQVGARASVRVGWVDQTEENEVTFLLKEF